MLLVNANSFCLAGDLNSLQFHRCYVVWGRHIYIAVVAGVCLLADSSTHGPTVLHRIMLSDRRRFCLVWGLTGAEAELFVIQGTFSSIYLWTVFSINIIVTAATGKLLFYISDLLI